MRTTKIITVGLAPAWDITCKGRELNWGGHDVIDSQVKMPAGKALNISRALAGMGIKSVAAGLWGKDDIAEMKKSLGALSKTITVKLTAVEENTRRNITVIDTAKNREMHLRCKSKLATLQSLKRLQGDLGKIVTRNSICVFAGAMPAGKLLAPVKEIIRSAQTKGAKVAVDTSGPALRGIVKNGGLWLIKPNVEELSELLGSKVADRESELVSAGRKLLGKVEIVLISRGSKGAVVVTKNGVWSAKCGKKCKVLSTVGCGDYMLAGFIKAFNEGCDIQASLETAVRVGSKKAFSC